MIAAIGAMFVISGILWMMADKHANGAAVVLVIGLAMLAAGGLK